MSAYPTIFIDWTYEDGETVSLSLREIGRICDRSQDKIYHYYKKCGCKTQQQILDKIKAIEDGSDKASNRKTHEFNAGVMSIHAYIEDHHLEPETVTYQILANRIRKYGPKSPVIAYPKMAPKDFEKRMVADRLTVAKATESVIPYKEEIKFDKSFCFRKGKLDISTIKCKYYSSCVDSRAFKKEHHARYRKDGDCYKR